jgi:5-methylcytosine-specific restriction endonuclease McrA
MADRTLVLNTTHMPLTVVSAERGLTLIMKGKVDLVASNGRVIRSEREEFHVPSVVVVRQFVHVPYNTVAPSVSRKAIFARDHGKCQYCDGRAENLDHVVPRTKGGRHTWDNLVAACKKCNSKKADKTLAQSGLKLLRAPKEPKGSKFFVFGRPEVEWESYLI